MDRTADANISSAAADIGKVGIDISVGGLRVLLQKRHCSHDLTGLAVAALRDILCKPGLLPDLAVGESPSMVMMFLLGGITDLNAA